MAINAAQSKKDSQQKQPCPLLGMALLIVASCCLLLFLVERIPLCFCLSLILFWLCACAFVPSLLSSWRSVVLPIMGSIVATVIVQIASPSSPSLKIVIIGPKTKGAHDAWADVMWGIRKALIEYRREPPKKEASADEVNKATEETKVEIRRQTTRSTVLIEYPDDGGDPLIAADRAQEIIRDSAVVAVIGHAESSVMKAALPYYKDEPWRLRVRRRPVVVITPACTAKSLTEDNAKKGVRNVFRIPPTDDLQAAVACSFTLKLFSTAPRVAIFRDGSNATYSNGIADEYRRLADRRDVDPCLRGLIDMEKNVRQNKDGSITRKDRSLIARVVFDGTNSNQSIGVFVTDSIADLEPDLFFFVGMARNAVPFIWQVRKRVVEFRMRNPHSKWNPTILITDGSVTKEFEEAADPSMTNPFEKTGATGLGKIYATFPLGQGFDDGINYSPSGYDAMRVLLNALEKADRIEKGSVLNFVNSNRAGSVPGSFNELIQFDTDGNRQNAKFHVLELEVASPTSAKVRFVKSPRCPTK